MGVASFVKGLVCPDYLGTVTPVHSEPARSVDIYGDTSVIGSAQYVCLFTPVFATERNVTWSIVSGDVYATIAADGLLAAKPGASVSDVTIRCVVTGTGIFADKDIKVSYAGTETLLFTKTRLLNAKWPSIYNPASGTNPDAQTPSFPRYIAAGTYKFKVTFPTNSGKVLDMNIQATTSTNAVTVFSGEPCDGATREYVVVVPLDKDRLNDRLTLSGTNDANIGGSIYIEGYTIE